MNLAATPNNAEGYSILLAGGLVSSLAFHAFIGFGIDCPAMVRPKRVEVIWSVTSMVESSVNLESLNRGPLYAEDLACADLWTLRIDSGGSAPRPPAWRGCGPSDALTRPLLSRTIVATTFSSMPNIT